MTSRIVKIHAVPGSLQDMFKHNPWRAPGQAPVFDPCGMAGGHAIPGSQGGEYNPTKYAKQGTELKQIL